MRFLLLYALAAAGGAVAYVPFLTLLLPLRVTDLAGAADITWLAYLTLAGAIVASASNVAFGWLSDSTRRRKIWVFCGLLISSLFLLAIPHAKSFAWLIAAIAAWQIGLNMMLAPLAAWAGDCVPDRQKGLLGGLLAFSPAMGGAAGAVITVPGLAQPDARIWIVIGMVAAMILPVLLFGRPHPMPHLMADVPDEEPGPLAMPLHSRSAAVRMWLARLLIQTAEAALFAYLLFWFRTIDSNVGDSQTARIFSVVVAVAVPVALIAGRWSDRANRPILPLVIASALAAAGLVTMAMAQGMFLAVAGYALFGLAASVFLSLHSSQTLRVLPSPAHRGRDLGLFNLTNTVPSMIMPWLTLGLVPVFGFAGLFWLLSGLAGTAGVLLLSLTRWNFAKAN